MTAMLELIPLDHLRSAQRRLSNAQDLYRQSRGRQYADAFLEFADVSMLVWSAGIDVISALMLLDGQTNLGTSTNRRYYLKQNLDFAHPQRDLWGSWRHLARLHNFQHNLDMPQEQFELNCRGSGGFIVELNELLPDDLRLPPESYGWLVDMR